MLSKYRIIENKSLKFDFITLFFIIILTFSRILLQFYNAYILKNISTIRTVNRIIQMYIHLIFVNLIIEFFEWQK